MGKYKFVDFTMCTTCEHYKSESGDDPCNECLDIPARVDSKKPENYKEKKK